MTTQRHGALAYGLLAVATIALTACGGGGGGAESAPIPPPTATPIIATASANLHPLDANLRLLYQAGGSDNLPVLVRTLGTRVSASGVSGTAVLRRDFAAGIDTVRIAVVGPGGVQLYAPVGADALERAFDGTDLMRWPAAAGDTYVRLDTTVDSGRDFDGDGRSDRVTLRAVVTAVALESVSTASDAFGNAFHHRQVLTQTVLPSGGGAPTVLETTTDTWFAPGYGPVKTVTAQRTGTGTTTTTTESVLQYRVGTKNSGDSMYPTVFGTAPTGRAPGSANAVVVFSEVLNAEAVTPDRFALRDPAGAAVPGALHVSGREVRFVPAQRLATGVYTATLARQAVQDVFENQAPSDVSWFFIVDATAPAVVATYPVDDAINVQLVTTVSVSFSEPPGRRSVNSSTVRVLSRGLPVAGSLDVNGNGVSFTPSGGLQRGTRYVVEVSGVTDEVGNPMARDLRFAFETTPGRFGSPERVPAAGNGSIGAASLAAGDINGDGIPDIVYADVGDDGYPDAVYVRMGRADGQLDPPVRLNLSTYFQATPTRRCPITALAIGDLTGDGRADVAVGSWNCGVLVVRQTASGALEPGQFIEELIQVLRIADLNGDGRFDLVGVQDYWNKAFVWLQNTDGVLALDQTPGLGDVAARDVAIGDINGDGRPDLIVALRSQDVITANIAILLQQPDGRFAPPRYLSTGTTRGIWGLAVGDFNGDGRLDIAGTTFANKPASLLVFLQAADGSFPAATAIDTMDGAYSVMAGDIDGDGRMDVVVNHEGWFQVGIYLQKADGSLAPEELYEAPGRSVNVQVLAIADINRDGLPDIIGPASLLRQVPLRGGGALRAATSVGQRASGRSGAP